MHSNHVMMYRNRIMGVLACAAVFLFSRMLFAGDGSSAQKTLQGAGPVSLAILSFSDITDSLGYDTQYEFPHGSYWCDVNDDGFPDLYVTTYGNLDYKDRYYENNGNKAFVLMGDVLGISDQDGGSHGACWADLDNDGDYDLINGTTIQSKLTMVPAANNLYRQISYGLNGFTDQTPSAMTGNLYKTRGVVAFDATGNGFLDIFTVSGYEGWLDTRPPTGDPNQTGEHPNEYIQNSGGWIFTSVTSGELWDANAGQGCTVADFDDDGDIDVFAANRWGYAYVMENDGFGVYDTLDPGTHGLYINTVADIGIASEGMTLGDVDNDGDLDIITVTYEGANVHLFKNNTYNPDSHQPGTLFALDETWATASGYMGSFGDLDNDGWPDLIVAGYQHPIVNDGVGNLSIRSTITIPYSNMLDPRSIAFADIDNDGDLDFASAGKHQSSYTHLIENTLSSTNHWLKVKLTSPQGQAGAFGAKVYVTPENEAGIYPKRQGGLSQIGLREAHGQNGYLGEDDQVLHFGLGTATTVDVTVEFVGGYRATRTNVSADQTITIDRADVQVALKVFLQGPYDTTGDTMKTDLRKYSFIPTTSPYSDSRQVDSMPADIVDWVYISLMQTLIDPPVASKSALLRNDGLVVADDGTTEYITMNAASGSYYIVVIHRNHINVMSKNPVSLSYTSSTPYDFTTALTQYYNDQAKELETGTVYGMYQGDANANDAVNATDYMAVRNSIGEIGYYYGDCNMNGAVNATDYYSIYYNIGATSQVP
ncbi:VCBS repeat-containing protein [bacterium]|nr:VCBS repeat-containing protein [bacterium]